MKSNTYPVKVPGLGIEFCCRRLQHSRGWAIALPSIILIGSSYCRQVWSLLLIVTKSPGLCLFFSFFFFLFSFFFFLFSFFFFSFLFFIFFFILFYFLFLLALSCPDVLRSCRQSLLVFVYRLPTPPVLECTKGRQRAHTRGIQPASIACHGYQTCPSTYSVVLIPYRAVTCRGECGNDGLCDLNIQGKDVTK